MKHYEVAIVGGGASGLFAGSILSKKAIILERNTITGKKLLITGGGRCNYTHKAELPELLEHYNAKESFVRHALYAFPPARIIETFNSFGIKPLIEDNGKVFPAYGDSYTIKNALEKRCGRIETDCFIKDIRKEGNLFILESNKKSISANSVILASGGNSYTQTGSDGYGYKLARNLGHTVIEPTPALSSIKLIPSLSRAEGISLSITIKIDKKAYAGDVVITKNGLSGPLAEDISYIFAKEKPIDIEFTSCNINKIRKENGKSLLKNTIPLPDRLISILLPNLAEKKLATVTKEEEKAIEKTLSSFHCNAIAIAKSAMSTHGGISTDEINPKTMESKRVNNLYFTGDIINVDANCGGYSLTWAFASAYLAAKAIDRIS